MLPDAIGPGSVPHFDPGCGHRYHSAVIPGATLTLTDTATNEKQVRISDDKGIFNFNALPADDFTLVVERQGFEKKQLSHLHLIPEQENGLSVQLQVGSQVQTVSVDASRAPAIDTETADTGATITASDIQQYASYERDVTQLTQLAPGVQSDGAQSGGGGGFQAPGTQTGASSGGGGNLGHSSSIFATENGASANAGGQQFQSNGYTVDGVSTVSAVWGGSTIVTPSEDGVSNVKIVTNGYDAEDGRFSGALTKITTRSGTNDTHGSFFWQIVRPGLDAYQKWNGPASVIGFSPTGVKLTPDQRGLLRDTDRYNQLGGSVGGPIWKDKIFYFFNYEGQAQNVAATSTGYYATSALTALAPAGSIASTYLNFPNAQALGTVVGAANCQQIALVEGVNCRTIAGQGLNIGSPLSGPLGSQDLSYVNASNPGLGGGLSDVPDIAEYTISNPTQTTYQQYNGRLDGVVTDRDHLSFTIYYDPTSRTNFNGGYGYDLFNHNQVNDAFTLLWNHTFSPTFVNEARGNLAGYRWDEIASNPQAPFGLPADYVTTIGNAGLGNFGANIGSHLDQSTQGYKDVATKVLHAQTIKFGGEYTRLSYLNDPIGAPNYTFYNLWDFLNDAPEQEGGPFHAATGLPGGNRNDNRENLWGFFIQDNWKVRPNLTLTGGLRYSYFGALTDKDNDQGVLTFGQGSALLTGVTIRTGIPAWNSQKFNFGPEVGFNWSPVSLRRLVVRGGYGLNYNQEQIANANNDDGNPPGTSFVPGNSNGPTSINPNILYAVSTSPTNLFGFPINPHTITSFNSAGLPTAGGANLGALTNNLPTEYTQHWSLDTEYDFGHGLVGSLSYLGSVGRHLLYNYNANALGVINGAPLNPLINGIGTFGNQGKSSDNQFIAVFKHQFSRTFSAEGQFTWGHSEDTNSGPYSFDAYLYNTGYTLGRSDFDLNKTFKVFGVWQPKLVPNSNDLLGKVVNGWSFSGILTAHSGYGYTPTYNIGPNEIYCTTCQYQFANLRPHYLGGAGTSTSNKAFRTGSNFANATPANTGADGKSFTNNYFSVPDLTPAYATSSSPIASAFIPAPGIGRNSLPGPGYRNVDITGTKSFGLPNAKIIGENAKIEIKGNFYNIFNLENIDPSSLSTSIQGSNLSQAGSALGSRKIDFQARFVF